MICAPNSSLTNRSDA